MKLKRCNFEGCKNKLSQTQLLTNKCKCNKYFCINHRLPEMHDCSYNFFNNIDKDKFISDNKCIKQKLTKI